MTIDFYFYISYRIRILNIREEKQMVVEYKRIARSNLVGKYYFIFKNRYFTRLTQFTLLFAVTFLFLISTPYANAGISLCTEAPCDDGESTCLNTQTCSIDSLPAGPQCSWCGTFCADECPEPEGPTVIVPTMGQWGMIIAALFLGFFAVLKLRRKTES